MSIIKKSNKTLITDLETLIATTPSAFTDEEMLSLLHLLDDVAVWIGLLRDHATNEAVNGKVYTGFKLVESVTKRYYINETAVADTVRALGYEPYEQKLRGIRQMEALLGKARFDGLLSDYVAKPQGKPILVPDSDKREEITL